VQTLQKHNKHKAVRILLVNIALKEAYETDYWLRLMHETQYLNNNAFQSIINDCHELEKLLI